MIKINCISAYLKMFRAFNQVDEADLVLNFYKWEDWRIIKPIEEIENYSDTKTCQNLINILNILTIKRNLVVVILDKRESEVKMEEIEIVFKKQGFKRIVFQAGVSNMHTNGRPILREVDLTDLKI